MSIFNSGVSQMLHPLTGAPVIRQLSKQRGDDGQHKVLVCEAEGSPKPSVSWSINGTSVRTQTLRDLTERSRFSQDHFLSQASHIVETCSQESPSHSPMEGYENSSETKLGEGCMQNRLCFW